MDMSLSELQELMMDKECCSLWGHKVSDLIEPLDNSKVKFGLRSNNREGTQPRPSTENWIKNLLSMVRLIRTRSSFRLSQSIPWGSFLSLLSFSIRGQTEWKPQSLKTNLIIWTTALYNSMKLWAMPCGATQDGWVMVEVLTKRGPLEKGMSNHFSILALRTPWTVWKGKKIGHWKMNSPGW